MYSQAGIQRTINCLSDPDRLTRTQAVSAPSGALVYAHRVWRIVEIVLYED